MCESGRDNKINDLYYTTSVQLHGSSQHLPVVSSDSTLTAEVYMRANNDNNNKLLMSFYRDEQG